MEEVPEVLIVAGSNICVYDSNSGNKLVFYKAQGIAPKTLSLINEDYLIGATKNAPKVNVWTVSNSKSPEAKSFTLPGVVNVLAVTSCGTFCAAGIKEQLHIWKVSSGELLNVLSLHYQDITCLRFSSDDSHILTGGEDGIVNVWVLSRVVALHIEKGQVKPRYVWNHHSSEVTDIYPGSLGCVSRIATTSLDLTCKIYELDSGLLLSTICLDVPLTSVVMDPMEYHVFLGAHNGSIYKINTYESLPKEFHCFDMTNIKFDAHEQKVTILSISMNGEKLLSASEDKCSRLWNVKSMSCLINITLDGGITNAFITMRPSAWPSSDEIKPQFPVRAFRREFDTASRKIPQLVESRMVSKPENLVELPNSLQFYSELLCGASKERKIEAMNFEEYKNEATFQQTLHVDTLGEIKAVNNQMYSLLVNRSIENSFQEDSD